MLIFDIETGPLPATELESARPEFDAPSNYKDPAKIAAYIEEKHREWVERAALSATTGRVLAIGYMAKGEFHALASGNETEDIAAFWDLILHHDAIIERIVGFNCLSFDLPFLVRRSWKLGLPIPQTLFRGRWLNEAFVDLMDVWKCGNRDQSISLGSLASFLGVGQKTGEGKDFARLWEADREAALAYLRNDLELTAAVAARLGIA